MTEPVPNRQLNVTLPPELICRAKHVAIDAQLVLSQIMDLVLARYLTEREL